MRIPSWAFTNLGQHLMDTKTDEFEIVDIDIPIIEIQKVEIQRVEIQKDEIQKDEIHTIEIQRVEIQKDEIQKDEIHTIEIQRVEVQKVEIPIFDETLQDAFVSMFENIAWYIYTKNNITSILAELYT